MSAFSRQFRSSLGEWWRERARANGSLGAASLLARELWAFLRDSTPARRRSRYGDMDYDWEQRVNTTSGAVGWRTRLLGIFHSPYQPTDPAEFRAMMAALPIDFGEFTFVDIGSGKGRALLLAAEYPFRKIIGVELLAELHRAAEENVTAWKARSGYAHAIEPLCMDARDYLFPDSPLVVYLFNPLPDFALRQVMRNLEASWQRAPRPIWLVYHNPLLESVVAESPILNKAAATPHGSVYRTN
ncbi:MAG: class I SAM-dependent methyltransferase [Terriglobales bacterium]